MLSGGLRTDTVYCTYCIASTFWILHFVFLHPINSTKHSPVSPASGEKKMRKAIILEMKYLEMELKIFAQL